MIAESSFLGGGEGGQPSFSSLETDFNAERVAGQDWYSKLEAREREWIRRGLNADVEFDKLYKTDPRVFDDETSAPWIVGLVCAAALFLVNMLRRSLKRRGRSLGS